MSGLPIEFRSDAHGDERDEDKGGDGNGHTKDHEWHTASPFRAQAVAPCADDGADEQTRNVIEHKNETRQGGSKPKADGGSSRFGECGIACLQIDRYVGVIQLPDNFHYGGQGRCNDDVTPAQLDVGHGSLLWVFVRLFNLLLNR